MPSPTWHALSHVVRRPPMLTPPAADAAAADAALPRACVGRAAIELALESMLASYRATLAAAEAQQRKKPTREERASSKLEESLSPRLGEMSVAEREWRERIMRGGQKSRPAQKVRTVGRLR